LKTTPEQASTPVERTHQQEMVLIGEPVNTEVLVSDPYRE